MTSSCSQKMKNPMPSCSLNFKILRNNAFRKENGHRTVFYKLFGSKYLRWKVYFAASHSYFFEGISRQAHKRQADTTVPWNCKLHVRLHSKSLQIQELFGLVVEEISSKMELCSHRSGPTIEKVIKKASSFTDSKTRQTDIANRCKWWILGSSPFWRDWWQEEYLWL